jgi:polysaccharide deacetylase 2 family uncharacterized protein YibQ
MKGKRGGARRNARFRPNPRRQFLYAALTFAALLVGFGVITLLKEPAGGGPKETTGATDATVPAQPWYKTRPPPAMITAPDAPIFPDEGTPSARAYEEALPQEIFVPDEEPRIRVATPSPAPVAAQKPQPTPPELTALPERPLPPWRRHAVAVPDTGARPVIALVIDDMGMDRKRSARVIGLKGPLTLSYLAYADGLDGQTAAARTAGHELLLHIPMEPGSKLVDPGPNVLLRGMKSAELKRRLKWSFDRFGSYVGVYNHMGSKFTADATAMVGRVLARRMGVPFLERNVFLDHENDVAAINARLAEVEKLALRKGKAIAIGHPREATIRALGTWLDAIEAKGFQLVPLTALLIKGREVAERP